MKLLFWISALFTAYAYIGYALWLFFFMRFHRTPVHRNLVLRNVSIIIAARNEEQNLPSKLDNLRQIDYPRENMQIIIASDGSTDRTAEILEDNRAQVCSVILDRARGKACALNEAVKKATGEILVFLDVRQTVDSSAIPELVSCFFDPSVGAVSGELLLDSDSGEGLGVYWHVEKMIRKMESATGSVVGVTGAIYAIRRELYREIPPGTLLDDVYVPMQIARLGKRVIFEPLARARDRVFAAKGKEFSRKVRTLTGNYQLLRLEPWLLTTRNPLLFRFVSHKLLRLFVPLFLAIMLVSSLLCTGAFYRTAFWLQMMVYVLALLGIWQPSTRQFKPVAIANTFLVLNAAAAVAFYNFVTGRDSAWA